MKADELLAELGRRIEDEYLERTSKSRALHERAQSYLPGGDTRTGMMFAPYPTYIERVSGSYAYDVDGNVLLDLTCNATSLIHGHAHPHIVKAIQEQAARGTAWAAPHELQLRLAQTLCERIPSCERVRFCNSGTEANMQAIKVARAFTGKDKIVKMDGTYHGTYEGTELDLDHAAPAARPTGASLRPATRGIPRNIADNVLVGVFNDRQSAEQLVAENRADLAAVIVNPVVTRGGLLLPEPGYLGFLRDITRRNGVLLIFDEVITLRVAAGGAQETYGVTPDLTAMGKIIGGGLPVGAFGGRADIMALFAGKEGLSHAGTFNGNALTMAAGIASLELLTPAAYRRLAELGGRWRAQSEAIVADLRLPFVVHQIASLVSLHLPDGGRPALAAEILRLLQLALLNRGVKSYSLYAISTVNTDEEIEMAARALRATLSEMQPAIHALAGLKASPSDWRFIDLSLIMEVRVHIETVLGPISPEQLGITLMHEHTLVDLWEWGGRTEYNSIMDDEGLLAEELGLYREAGGTALVDVTNIGDGRNPAGLRRLAQATGLHLIMGAGWYRERIYPDYVHNLDTNQLADMLIGEWAAGADGAGVRPGIIGEIGTERFRISPAEEKVFRACARAQQELGVSITTHTTHFGELAFEQIALLMEEGVPPARIIVGHLGERRDAADVIAIARQGVFVQIDHVGRPASAGCQPEARRARNVVDVARAGFLEQVLISMDICANSLLHYFGGHGYDYLLRTFVPLLEQEGLSKAEIRTILVDNPRRALAY